MNARWSDISAVIRLADGRRSGGGRGIHLRPLRHRQNGQAAWMLDLGVFRDLISSLADDWSQQGVEHSMYASPDDGRSKAASWVRVEVGEVEGELIVWDSGEGELLF